MTGRAIVNNALLLALALVLAVVGWIALGLLGWAVNEPARQFTQWIGPAGNVALFVTLMGGGYALNRWATRRDFRRQFAADRTIHVEKRSRLQRWPWWAKGLAIVSPMLAVVIWTAFMGP